MSVELENINGGTGGSGGGSSSKGNLFDVKTMAEAIAEKGWAFLCKSTRQDLVKIDVPTIYADILDKYNNADKDFVTNENTEVYSVQYDSYSNKFIYKPKSQNKLYSSDLVDLSNPTDLGISDVYEFMLGQNINIVKGYANSSGGNYYIYSKDWELIRTINVSSEYNNIANYRYVNGAFLFLVNDNDNFHKVCYLMKFEDNINVENAIISNNYKLLDSNYRGMNISDIIDNKIYITCAGGSNGWNSWFLEINFSDLSYVNVYKSNIPNNTYNNYANLVKYDDNYYFGSISGVYKSTDLINWTLIYSLDTPCYYIEKINNIYYIICNGEIITTENFVNFDTIITFTGSASNNDNKFLNCYVGNNIYVFNFKQFSSSSPLYLYSLSTAKTYTDTYVINGNEVAINYYTKDGFKICLADNTNDTNLATVYSYLGYYNYYRLDTANETISLPRNSNLYSMMYVGDNYQDTLDGIRGNATRLLPQAEVISDSSASVSLDVKGNKDYQLLASALTSLTLSTCEDSQLGTTILFNSGATATTITDSASIDWVDGATPIPSANVNCLIFIWNKIGFYKEW